MNGFVFFCYGGPIIWKPVHQSCTSIISCDTEVQSTNECKKMIQHLRHVLSDLSHISLFVQTKFYIGNHACVGWSKSHTTYGIKQISIPINTSENFSITTKYKSSTFLGNSMYQKISQKNSIAGTTSEHCATYLCALYHIDNGIH